MTTRRNAYRQPTRCSRFAAGLMCATALITSTAAQTRAQRTATERAPGHEVLASVNALRDCRRAAADATGAPWGVERSAARCQEARARAPEAPEELQASEVPCWEALARAIDEMRTANRLYEQSRHTPDPEGGRLNAEARRHHQQANAAIDRADECIAGAAELAMRLWSALRGRPRGERPQPRPRPGEVRETPRPAPWNWPAAEAAEDPCQDRRLGLRPLPRGGIERLDGGFDAAREQRQQLQSNHPEILSQLPDAGAILVSTLVPTGKAHPDAHLDHAFARPFRVLISHQNQTGRAAYQTLALHNPGARGVRVDIEALASTTTSEAPYQDLAGRPFPALAPNPGARDANGPGDRTATRILLGEREGGVTTVVVPPHGTISLHTALHAARQELVTQAELVADGALQAAVIYTRVAPTPADLARVLQQGALVARSANDPIASPPGAPGSLIYGRVAGVVGKSTFDGAFTNDLQHRAFLAVAHCERRYAFNTRRGGPQVDLGTGLDQAGPLARGASGQLLRYPDAAYANNGNYGAEFFLRGQIVNPTARSVRVRAYIDTPGQVAAGVSRALRNTLAVTTEEQAPELWYANQRSGTLAQQPLANLVLAPGQTRDLVLRFFYAANNTSPHILRVRTD